MTTEEKRNEVAVFPTFIEVGPFPMFYVNEDGTTEEREVLVKLNRKSFMYSAALPAHVFVALDEGETVESGEISRLVEAYGSMSERYQRWKLGNKTTDVLLVDAITTDTYGFGFRFAAVAAIGGSFYVNDANGEKVRTQPAGKHHVVLADSSALRDKLYDLVESVQQMKTMFRDALDSENPEDALLAIPTLTKAEMEAVIAGRKTPAAAPTEEPKPAVSDDDDL